MSSVGLFTLPSPMDGNVVAVLAYLKDFPAPRGPYVTLPESGEHSLERSRWSS